MYNTENRINTLISKILGIKLEKILPHLSFMKDLNVDSLDKIEIIMALEEEFNIEITDEDAEKINTVQDSINYIKNSLIN